MTASDKQICHLTARTQRLLSAQAEAEAEGDPDMACCLRLALGRLAEEAQRVDLDAGHDQAHIDRVVAALPPAEAADLQARLEEFETLEG